jgi:hypothetical protein
MIMILAMLFDTESSPRLLYGSSVWAAQVGSRPCASIHSLGSHAARNTCTSTRTHIPLRNRLTSTVAMGEIGTADGSAVVRLGRTSCVAGIKAELSNPPIENPGHGWLVPNVSITSVCSPDVPPGPPPPQAQALR